ncbi:hypothetical protein [Streptomyces sp. NPDC095602]|uniref:hypothetical protein n=1 Tax=Streptomyces sp. NPDC095602 TaxID=3155819 RepID=UPI0033306488
MRTYEEIQAAYDARKLTQPFGYQSVNFFGNLDILTLKNSERAGNCQVGKCYLPAPAEIIGHVKGEVSGCKFTRTIRICAWHFWDGIDYVLWLR